MFSFKIKLSFSYCIYIFMVICVSKGISFPTQSTCNCISLESCDEFNTLRDKSLNESHLKAVVQEAVCYFDGFNIFVCCPSKYNQKRQVKDKPKLDYLDESTGLNCPPSFGKEYNYDDYLKTHQTFEDDYDENSKTNGDANDANHRHQHSRVICDYWGNCNTFTFPKNDDDDGEHSYHKTTHNFPPYYHDHDHDHHGHHGFHIPFFPHSHHNPHNHNTQTEMPVPANAPNAGNKECGMLPKETTADTQVYPWITRLAYLNTTSRTIRYRCMGTIISDQHVLTAAHCVDKLVQDLRLIYIRVGDDLNFDDFKILETTVHPSYNEPLFNNDVAVLRLAKTQQSKVTFTKICLPQIERDPLMGNIGVVAGWSNSGVSTADGATIRYINLPIMNNTECAIRYAQYSENFETSIVITPTEFCAKAQAMNDVCEGDSGGPFMDRSNSGRLTLLGIVAFGPKTNCGQSNLPGVYMRISSYVEWITNNIK